MALTACCVALVACSTPNGADREPGGSGKVEANATVERVVDGDTMIVDRGDQRLRVRMIGLDTPESVDPRRPVECYGTAASAHLGELAPAGTAVRLEADAEPLDKFGRTLAYVYRASDGLFLNLQMVADGYAHVLTIPPNVTFADAFRRAERDARAAGRGLRSACPDAGDEG